MEDILKIRNLKIEYHTDDGVVRAVNGVDLQIKEGECLGLVGETGAGKTTMALGIMNLLPNPQGKYTGGELIFDGKDIIRQSAEELRSIRGKRISMIFQDPMTSLNPVIPVGEQIAEVIRLHEGKNAAKAIKSASKMLETVGISADRYDEYPHQFSGGMRQRVGIAIALACNPELLIADEPTTALDVTIQAQVLELMKKLKNETHTSTILISHDLGVVAEMCDRVAIMYCGEIMEYGTLRDIYKNSLHPYTVGLFGSIPHLNADIARLRPIPGIVPDPSDLPPGCPFFNRCSIAEKNCETTLPPVSEISESHGVRCHFVTRGVS
jgi:peptide/nickel transport system ATP-binding protein